MNRNRICKLLIPALVPPVVAVLLAWVFFVLVPARPAASGSLERAPMLACPPSQPPQPGPQLIVNTTVMTTCDGVCGLDHCTLREAIRLANTLAGSNTIELGSGVTYVLTAADNGINGYPLITSTLTIHGNCSTITRSPAAPPSRLFKITSGGALTLTQLALSNGLLDHSIIEAKGAGVYNEGALSISECTFIHNACDADATFGGAIYNYLGVVAIYSSTFISNTATSYMSYGGAIYSSGGRLDILNSTFVDNLAGGDYFDQGGALYASSPVTITNSTFFGNRSKDNGGTIFVLGGSSLLLRNTIVSTGAGATGCSGAVVDGGGNLSWPDNTCPGVNQDPKIGPLALNGGSTRTMALHANSPAIHHAVPANCPAQDQRGRLRGLPYYCDSGAFEFYWLLFQPFISKY
jgi:predicted outer membrane repeat protein